MYQTNKQMHALFGISMPRIESMPPGITTGLLYYSGRLFYRLLFPPLYPLRASVTIPFAPRPVLFRLACDLETLETPLARSTTTNIAGLLKAREMGE